MSGVHRCSRWTVQGITCPLYATDSRVKEQETVNFLEKKVDGMKGYDLGMTVTAAIMCLGTVLGSGFIMVAGGSGALAQTVIQLAVICGTGGIYAPARKGNACVITESYID
eukprot:13636149-Ditylum_brightwellii.AAC.1